MKIFVFFFLFFFGMAFSQDSSFVLLPQDSVAKDSVVKDSIVENTVDTASIDTSVVKNTLKAISIDTSSKDSAKIKSGLHFFVSVGAQFINFKERSKFQDFLNARYKEYENDYKADSVGYTLPIKQDFETVNLTFPISAGIIWQLSDVHSFSLGVVFLYDNESVILTDKQDEIHNLKYTLQAFPAFAEYRLLISPNFISLKDNDYFSLFLRYYWLLPPTKINSSWGNAKADFEPLGNGYGIFLGYRFWEWAGLSIFGEMGFLSLDAKSSTENGILDSWNLGGISILVRAMF
jgi:hypothetical protein